MAFTAGPIGKFLVKLPKMLVFVAGFAVAFGCVREDKERRRFWWFGGEDFIRFDVALSAFETDMSVGSRELEVGLIVIERQPFLKCLGAMTFFTGFGCIFFRKLLRMDIFVTRLTKTRFGFGKLKTPSWFWMIGREKLIRLDMTLCAVLHILVGTSQRKTSLVVIKR